MTAAGAGGPLVVLLDADGAAVGSGLAGRLAAEAVGLDAALLILTAPGAIADTRALASLLRERPAGPEVAVAETLPGTGAVAAANVGLAVARASGRDALLLPAGTTPRVGTIAELVAVAMLDPMIGFVAPRSNDADIANSPYHDVLRPPDPAIAEANHAAIQPHLPRFTFAPTLPATALLVRHAMLREFGLFDEAYGDGPHEQHDLIRRCNRCGYRAVLANHGYVARAPAPVDAVTHARNAGLLNERYPEHHRAALQYAVGAHRRAQAQMSGLVPDASGRLRVLFDCRMLKPAHNGTFEHMTRLIAAFVPLAADRFVVSVLADDEAFRFHRLDRIPGLGRHGDGADRGTLPYAIAFRVGQPFIREDVLALAQLAPITGFLMLDTIALDCAHLSDRDLDALWRTMADTVDLVGANSEASLAQFRRRFRPDEPVHDFVSRCSTDVADYGGDTVEADVPRGGVLLVGNRYEHKHLAPTFAALRARVPDIPIRVLGISEGEDELSRHALGELSQDEVAAYYRAADVVLYPSHYEGFGLPILHALAARTPVVARDLPSAREIAARTPLVANIHLAADTDALVALAAAAPAWTNARREPADRAGSWRDAAVAVADAFDRALAGFDYDRCVARQARFAGLSAALDADHAATDAATRAADANTRADVSGVLAEEAGRRAALAEAARVDAEHERERAAQDAERTRAEAARAATLSEYGVAGDFTLGDTASLVAAAIVSERPTRWRPWPGRRCDARLGDGPFAEPRERIRLDARGLASDDAGFLPMLLGWARAVAMGGAMTLVARGGADDASGALLAAGFCPVRIRRRWRIVEIDAVRLIDWAAPLPGPPDDAPFVTIAYRRALGRDPDPSGEAHFRAVLAGGTPREAVLAAIMASPERPAMIERAIARGRA